MTIVRIAKRHVDREAYEALVAELDLDHQHPLGLIVHGASEIDGVMHVAQIWDSEEYARRYEEQRLKPALRAVGAPLDMEVSVFEINHLVTP